MAYEQEHVESCEEVLRLAEAGAILLAVPAFCFIEPMDELRRKRDKHRQLSDGLRQEFRERQRVRVFAQAQEQAWAEVQSSLVTITQEAEQRVNSIHARLLRCSEILPTGAQVIAHAATLQVEESRLHFPDAVVLASVLLSLREASRAGQKSCLFNSNKQDFETPTIVELLRQQQCTLKVRFDHGLSFIQAALKGRAG
ncbi:hypothetical protein D7V97_34185 [Corallococcus sp. CA053C]|uniref:hypothetical protein n=1 Tax=Corallococcus sp. CA053C TaxID=2316732 RepID=UPI000EA364BF|nr:hypothetical protein [Corallococcus sp. CA053C]RKG97566.1 hypothetical protein D7V97_34185 [Corallococcus sp. CA053C]